MRSLIEYLLLAGRQSSQKRFLYYPGSALGGAGPNWEQFRSAEVPSQLAPRSVELGAGPSWEQLVNWLKAGPVCNGSYKYSCHIPKLCYTKSTYEPIFCLTE